MDVCLHLFCVSVVLCAGSGLATGWSPVQYVKGLLTLFHGIRRPRSSSVGIAADWEFDGPVSIPGSKRSSLLVCLDWLWAQPTSYPVGTAGPFPEGKAVRAWRWTQLHLVPWSRKVELYLHSHICLHGIVINYLSTGTTLSFCMTLEGLHYNGMWYFIGRAACEIWSAAWNLGTNSAFSLGPRRPRKPWPSWLFAGPSRCKLNSSQ
jgi:hypothetical protein